MATKNKLNMKSKAMGAKKRQRLSVSATKGRLSTLGYGGPLDINPAQQFASKVDLIGGAAAQLGSGLIDAFARPDELGEDFRQVDINEGARAGKAALKGAASGAAAGSAILPGIGTLVGGAVGGIGGALSGWFGGKNEEKQLNQEMNEKLNKFQSTNRLSTMKQSPTYLPVAKLGGAIGGAGLTAYRGETHKGPTGGILVDQIGNPTGLSTSSNKPVALTEDGEFGKYDPTTGETYIFSKSLGFGKPVNDLVNRFKLNKPNSVYNYDILTKAAVDKQLENIVTAQEFAKGTDTKPKEAFQMAKGGYLSSAKAGKMLEDGTIRGKKLTPKQKRYFGWVAGGKKAEGGPLTTGEVKTPLPAGSTPVYAREFSNPVNLSDEAYLFQPGTEASNNYYYPENVINKAKSSKALPTFTGKRGFDVGYTPYQDRTDLLPAGGYTVGNNSDTTFYRLEPEVLPDKRTVYNYNKSNRKGINESMNLVTTGSYNTDPTQSARFAGIAEYYKSIGQPIPKSFDRGGELPKYETEGYLTPQDYVRDIRKLYYNTLKGTAKTLWSDASTPFKNVANWYTGRPVQEDIDLKDAILSYYNTPTKGNGVSATKSSVDNSWIGKNLETGQPITGGLNVGLGTSFNAGFGLKQDFRVPYGGSTGGGTPRSPKVEGWGPSRRLVGAPATASLSPTSGYSTQLATKQPAAAEPEKPHTPWLNPAGHILSAAGNLADYFAMKKARPEDVRMPRVGAERIDLSRQRLINERQAASARATNVANTRKLGMNAGATFSNLAASNTGVNRLLGEQNMQSLMTQESANAQMEQQANMANAQIGAEEAMINSRQQNAYRAAMARMNPLGNMARTAASYFADNAAYGQGYDTLQMLAPNAELYGPNETFLDRFRKPKVRLRDRTL